MKKFETFCDFILDNILEYLPERFSQGELTLQGIIKNNSAVRHGLSIRMPDSEIAPIIYLENYYQRYKNGAALETICQNIASVYQENMREVLPFVTELINNFEKAQDLITMKVVSAKTNGHFLRERPSTKLDDLAVFYQIEVDNMQDGRGTIPITTEIFRMWNVPLSEVHQKALENTERLFPSKLSNFEAKMRGIEENFLSGTQYYKSQFPMLLLTNSEVIGGAAAIANPDILHRVSEVIDDSYYIIPSSIHEVLILPKSEAREIGLSMKELGEIVRSINAGEVYREDQLSDHLYMYDRNKRTLETVQASKEKSMNMER